ncbi:hypothetical protein V6N12_067229 [Hibiscus sabdariffa]|uniref:RING-type E3 ubiquitin transferase n=1 Tax=Hibiscus sabdariffa TaxID=183260 RepID=A0ABR2BE06_9ROSI
MASRFSSDDNVPANTTAVAIDKDKNSPHAVRWAIDHLIVSNSFIVLIHVRNKSQSECESDVDINQLFVPFRGYCARKGIQMKDVVLEDADASKAILDYISRNLISNIVLGASTRSAISSYLSYKKIKSDIPTTLIKSAPDFCSVYVISKGKIVSVRAAQRHVSNTVAPPKAPLGMPLQIPSDLSDDDGYRGQNTRGVPGNAGPERLSFENSSRVPTRDRPRSSPGNMSFDIGAVQGPSRSPSRQDSFSSDIDFAGISMGSVDISDQNLEFDFGSSGQSEPFQQCSSSRDLEDEMRRLKLELKQTMDMYSSACKEALTAKKTANELHQWKKEEARRFEEARQAEEAALAMAEKEKAKCKVAIEAAEAAQRLAEIEAYRRKQAEYKAKQESDEKNRALHALAINDVRYRKYTIEEIEEATGNFTAENKIGEGGYGPVYKGKLDHTPVAIKILRPDAAQGKRQFQQEVEVLCSIRHPNMVLLLGACPEYGCLVYEYMHNGSLEDRLFRKGNSRPLSWRRRFKIAAEIATALLFLHQSKPEPLVHRDLKPANILLDRNFVSKISDVGLARLVPPSVADSVTQYRMTSAAGTFCYIDPEYQQTGMLTTRSDIYSLGIMLLQIITAKPPMGIAHHVGRAIEKGTLSDLLDPAVPNWPLEEALSYAQLALKCAELRKRDRPDLATVIVPELNRLRDIGYGNNSSSSSGHYQGHSSSDHSHGFYTCSGSRAYSGTNAFSFSSKTLINYSLSLISPLPPVVSRELNTGRLKFSSFSSKADPIMDSDMQNSVKQQQPAQRIQIYPPITTGVSPFWIAKYERDAKKYWDQFYRRHQDKFFKDRHYLDKEWDQYFSRSGRKVILEVGCGAGNAVFPLIATYPDVFVYACDFSQRAVNLVKAHKDFNETRVSAFVCDLTADDLSEHISPASVDVVTMIFVLSAVSPEKMPLVLQNVKKVLKPNGHVLFRDYAVGDLAQERFSTKDQQISENFYVRGDGTRAYYFSNEFLTSLFKEQGLDAEELGLCCKQVENRARELVMNRRWVQAVFRFSDSVMYTPSSETPTKSDLCCQEISQPKADAEPISDFVVDMSEGMAVEMFGVPTTNDNEVIKIELGGCDFKIQVLSKEHQHTCKSTGLMLWESARLMAAILARNPSIVAGKRVLELGSGCGGICSMVAAGSASIVVATDGDSKALELLNQNITSNLRPPFLNKLVVKELKWGNRDDIDAIKAMNNEGFEVIIGTDVTYIPEAILPLFSTARELISSNSSAEKNQTPALILCHIFRRVDEPSLLSAASQYGFRLVDKWAKGSPSDESESQSLISSWFPENSFEDHIPTSALNIMYFKLD